MRPEVIERLDLLAETVPCERCRHLTLLRPGGLCAGCIADIGQYHPEEHTAWRTEVRRRTERMTP